MRVCVLYTPAEPDAPAQDLDGLVQRDAVLAACAELGHLATAVAFVADLDQVKRDLAAFAPDRVFNLVESVAGHDRLQVLAPAWLDALGLPYTGGGLDALVLTTHKLLAKRWMAQSGLPTPAWMELGRESLRAPAVSDTVIVKSVWDHGSAGLDANSLRRVESLDALHKDLQQRKRNSPPGTEWFAETFIDGREFNISVLGGPQGPEVLPHAEIRFDDFAPGMPRLVDYKAKWDEDSFEYHHTPRSFEFPAEDLPLLTKLGELSLACWRLFDIRGFARVDFRVDEKGQPWILEININPCISPDAGFAAAVARAGMKYEDAVARILDDIPGAGDLP